jgi:2-dehydropantoate 2-reductase
MKIALFGAGAIGGYVGGCLAVSGVDVVMVGRPRLQSEIASHGMRLTDLDGHNDYLAALNCPFTTDAAALWDADIIVVTVKSGATLEAAKAIVKHARPDALLVSFQNGIGNADMLRRAAHGRTVLAAMVPWNVELLGDGRFHRGTDGVLMIENHPQIGAFAAALRMANLATMLRNDMPNILWSKLLLNLNNGVNALSGLPLRAQLADRDYRLCLAACVEEALQILAAAKIVPAPLNKIPPEKLPGLLRLPNLLYGLLMRFTLRIDDQARSSMQNDIRAGRPTEIDLLSGEVVALARKIGRKAPYNLKMQQLVTAAKPDTAMSGEALRRLLYL